MSTGFTNENDLYSAMCGKKSHEISKHLQDNIILKLDPDFSPNGIVLCSKMGGNKKPDLELVLNKKSYFLSIKKGSGNSVHQEKLDTFIPYLQKEFNVNPEIVKYIKLFIWSDGTIDGSGQISDRMSIRQMAKKYNLEKNIVQTFFEINKKKLIRRFMQYGRNEQQVGATHVYYGEVDSGCLKSIDQVIDYLVLNNGGGILNIGKLSFQAWNIVQNGNPNTEDRRGVIQLKWGGINTEIFHI